MKAYLESIVSRYGFLLFPIVSAAILGLSWLMGQLLGLVFKPADPGTDIMAGLGTLMIIGISIGAWAAAREKDLK